MRIVKEADERKNEILDAAGELFAQKGFDGTSTNDILEKVGIARGTLYYHFKSKEDIMDAMIERTTAQMIMRAQKIARDKSMAVTERMLYTILALNVNDIQGKELTAQMHKPQNALMHQKVQKVTLREVTPLLTEIIEDGISQELFHTPYPNACMEMVLLYACTVFDDDDTVELTETEKLRRIQAFVYNMERLVGAETGSLTSTITKMFQNHNN